MQQKCIFQIRRYSNYRRYLCYRTFNIFEWLNIYHNRCFSNKIRACRQEFLSAFQTPFTTAILNIQVKPLFNNISILFNICNF